MATDYLSPQVGANQFVTQRIGNLVTGTGAEVAKARDAGETISPTQSANPVKVESRQQVLDQFSQEKATVGKNYRAGMIQQAAQLTQKRKQREAAATASRGGGAANTQNYGNMSNAGMAYTPDGNLSASRNAVLAKASSYVGGRYVLGGNSYSGIDCSGLTQQVYGSVGLAIPRLAAQQRDQVPGVRTSIANLRPGDLVAWKDGSHVAVYAGNGRIIAAASPELGVITERVWGNVVGIALRLPGE